MRSSYSQIVVELVISFVLVVIGQLIALKLKPIRLAPDVKAKSYDEVLSGSDFMVFNHRGKALAARLDGLKRK